MKKLIALTALLALTSLNVPAEDAKLEGWRQAVAKKLESTPAEFSTTDTAKVEVIKEEAAARKLTAVVEKNGDFFKVTVSLATVAQK
jgi:hypothetical protein